MGNFVLPACICRYISICRTFIYRRLHESFDEIDLKKGYGRLGDFIMYPLDLEMVINDEENGYRFEYPGRKTGNTRCLRV